MDIRQWHFIVLISCVLILTLQNYVVSGKPFSLNKVIARDSKKIKREDSAPTTALSKITEKFSLLRGLRGLGETKKNRKIKRSGIVDPSGVLPSLHHKKKYQIKTPLKSNNLLKEHRARLKRKNSYLKREINQNEGINHKYMPLFQSLSFLFDGILNPDFRESGELSGGKYKRRQHAAESGIVCKCARKSDLDGEESQPAKETVAAPATSEVRHAERHSAAQTDTAPDIHIGHLKQHKKLSSLSPRDPVSSGRDGDGIRTGGGAADQSSAEGYIPKSDGSGGLGSRTKEISGFRRRHHEITKYGSRSRAGDDVNERPRFRGDLSGEESKTAKPGKAAHHLSIQSQTEDTEHVRNNANPKTFNLKVGGNEKHGKTILPDNHRQTGPERGDRGIDNDQQTASFQENYEGNDIDAELDSTDQRKVPDEADRSAIVEEDQKTHATNQGRITLQDLSKATPVMQSGSKNKAPLVTIIDGYSVARDKNGANNFSEKSIRIHS